MTTRVRAQLLGLAMVSALLGACGVTGPSETGFGRGDGPPEQAVDLSAIADAVPKPEPRSRSGNPASYEVRGVTYHVMDQGNGYQERGIASWYGSKFHGRLTSSGEPYDMLSMTAAHRTLPLPSYVAVTNLENGKRIVVKVNDRGPFLKNRLIDLSYAAAGKLGILDKGTGLVEVRYIDPGQPRSPTQTDPGRHDLYIQVGAFANHDNALNLRNRLQGTQIPRIFLFSRENEHPLYRVRIGPLASVADVDRIGELLTNLGVSEQHVVID